MQPIPVCCQCFHDLESLDDRAQYAYNLATKSFDHGSILELMDEPHLLPGDVIDAFHKLETCGYVITTESAQNRLKVFPSCHCDYYGNGLTYCSRPKEHLWAK
jgi:hypothetical protein